MKTTVSILEKASLNLCVCVCVIMGSGFTGKCYLLLKRIINLPHKITLIYFTSWVVFFIYLLNKGLDERRRKVEWL